MKMCILDWARTIGDYDLTTSDMYDSTDDDALGQLLVTAVEADRDGSQ